LLAIVERDLVDAEGEISAAWRFGIAYNAALKLCTILLHASGPSVPCSTTERLRHCHWFWGNERKDDADYLETCRTKRNAAEYEMAGVATEKDAKELVEFVKDLREDVLNWLNKHHTELMPRKAK